MHVKEFERKIRKCNKDLHIFFGMDDSKPAGVWHNASTWSGGEYQSICGIDKGWLPEHPITNDEGRIIKGGWRRVIAILVALKLVDKFQTYKYFGHWDEHRVPPQTRKQYMEDVNKEIAQAQKKGYFKRDELVDIGREINRLKPTGV